MYTSALFSVPHVIPLHRSFSRSLISQACSKTHRPVVPLLQSGPDSAEPHHQTLKQALYEHHVPRPPQGVQAVQLPGSDGRGHGCATAALVMVQSLTKTGGGTGMGLMQTLALIENGAKVLIVSRDEEKLEGVAKKCGGDGQARREIVP